jgi:hypothetical protein
MLIAPIPFLSLLNVYAPLSYNEMNEVDDDAHGM